MLLALNYPVGLHDLCYNVIIVMILQLRHTSNRVTKALVRLILAFGVRLCGKKKGVFSGHFVISRCFQNELLLKQINNNEI